MVSWKSLNTNVLNDFERLKITSEFKKYINQNAQSKIPKITFVHKLIQDENIIQV